MGYDPEKQTLVQGQASDGCKKPAIPCRQTHGTGHRRAHISREEGDPIPICFLEKGVHLALTVLLSDLTLWRCQPRKGMDHVINRVIYSLMTAFLKAIGNSSVCSMSSDLHLDLNRNSSEG